MTYRAELDPPARPLYGISFEQRRPDTASTVPFGGAGQPHIPAVAKTRRRGRSAWIWVWGVLAIGLIALVSYFVAALGAPAAIIGLIVALIPFAIVVSVLLWVDRWEPEPAGLVVFALAWGGIAAVCIALLVDLFVQRNLPGIAAVDVFGTVVQAPIVEEIAKGIGILLIVVMGRRAFDGPVDGVVYGALVGAGFAFTENIQYFAVSVIDGGAQSLTWTFVMRGLLSPFAHAMFTGVTGFFVGVAVSRGSGMFGRFGVGVVGAVALHALWNGAAAFTTVEGWLHFYVILQMPLFALFIFFTIRLRREEERLTAERLNDYAAVGWFTPQEVWMLATPSGRRQGLAWSRTLRVDRSNLMRSFIRDATALAATRQRIISGRDPHAAEEEKVLLERAVLARQALLSV